MVELPSDFFPQQTFGGKQRKSLSSRTAALLILLLCHITFSLEEGIYKPWK